MHKYLTIKGHMLEVMEAIGTGPIRDPETGEIYVAVSMGTATAPTVTALLEPQDAYAIAEQLMDAADAAVQAMVEADLEVYR